MINILVICGGVPPFYVTANDFMDEIVCGNNRGGVDKFPVKILFGSSGNGKPDVLLTAGERLTSFSEAFALWENVRKERPRMHFNVNLMRRRKIKKQRSVIY